MSNLNLDDVYTGSGDFIKAADLNRRRVNLTIAAAKLETLQDGPKIVLDFEGTPKRLVLNKTNGNMIAELLGSRDALLWIGSTITLRPDKTQLKDGRTVDCIRVDIELPDQKNPNSLGARVLAANPAFGQTPAQAAPAAAAPAQTAVNDAFANTPQTPFGDNLVPQGLGEQIPADEIPF